MKYFNFVTPITYWILIVLWAYILNFYVKRLRGELRKDKLLFVLFVILSIDAFRTLFESFYFGAWYTSLAGFLPMEVHAFLVQPEMVFIPKTLNVIAAVAVIFILLYRWVPQEAQEIRKLEKLVENRTLSLRQEIQNRSMAEEKVKKHAKNLEVIFNSTPNILALINAEGRVDMINHKGTDFVKKGEKEILGLLGGEVFNCINTFDGKECGRSPDCHTCPIRTRVMSTLDTGHSHLDESGQMIFIIEGEERLFHLSISTTLLEIDGTNKILLSLTDVTEHLAAEQKLWDSNQKFQKVFDSHLDAIFLLNNETPPKILNINDAAKNIFGYQNNELLGRTTECLHVSKSNLAVFKNTLDTAIKDHSYLDDFEFSMKRKDGTVFVSEHRVVELKNDDEERTGWVSIVRDLTERKQIQEQLQQSQRMEAIGNLAGGVAHDFNNILFPIVGMAELLLEDLSPDSPEHENAQEILTAGHRGSELVKQILSFSRQNKHKMIPLKVQNILKEVLKLTRATIPSSIELSINIQQNCDIVLGDPTQIHQVAMNLITNAYHAIEAAKLEGTISITLKQIKGKDCNIQKVNLNDGECLMLSVSDNGVGIQNNLMDKLFEPYFTTKKKDKGTGLGLAVVLGIIKEHGGDIKVTSEENIGTSFDVYLPLLPKGIEINNFQEKDTILVNGDERILLIDDEEPISRLVKQMLQRLGYKVKSCTSSMNALSIFKANPNSYDLIISDLSMPQMTGEQLAMEILSIKPSIPIIICTGFSERMNEDVAKKMGIKGFLMKPIVKLDMAKMIKKVLNEKTV